MSIEIEKLNVDSQNSFFEEVSNIHQNEISEGFLATFGNSFLSILYKTIATSEYSFIYIAKSDNKVIGFICGCRNTSKLYFDFLIRAGYKAIFLIIPKLLNPKKIFRIFETLLYPSKKVNKDLPESEILNFCVDSSIQGKGVGKMLFNALVTEFRNSGIEKIKIVTGKNQISAQRFYEKIGAEKVADIEIHKETESLIFTYNCS